MLAHRIEAVIQDDRTILVKDVPFHAGEVVEVIILPRQPARESAKSYPLRGTPIEYQDPFQPVADLDPGCITMIVLDTHIRVWWVHGDPHLSPDYLRCIQTHEEDGLGISSISVGRWPSWSSEVVYCCRFLLPIGSIMHCNIPVSPYWSYRQESVLNQRNFREHFIVIPLTN